MSTVPLNPVQAPVSASAPVSPAALSGPRSFTVPLLSGGSHVESCPSGCVSDHAADMGGAFLADLYHRIGEAAATSLAVFDADEGTVEVPVLAAQVQVDPYHPDPRFRVPHVNLEVTPDEVVEGLGPEELGVVVGRLREHLVALEALQGRLVSARADWLER